ncbi:MAG: hypothetical protein MMC33_001387 [Icmadophila ericetorum]|nr:hypothetical protein [Icmadophila ericetorum]
MNADAFTVGEWEEDEEDDHVVHRKLASCTPESYSPSTEGSWRLGQCLGKGGSEIVGAEQAPNPKTSTAPSLDNKEDKPSGERLIAWGIEAAQLLSDAFFFHCGFRGQNEFAYTKKDLAHGVLIEGKPVSRALSLLHLRSFLKESANLGRRELCWILSRDLFRGVWSEEDSARLRQNPDMIPVWEVAHHLMRMFELAPDYEAEIIILKLFRWLTGRGTFQAAFDCRDTRFMTIRGIQNEVCPFFRMAYISPEEQAIIDRL